MMVPSLDKKKNIKFLRHSLGGVGARYYYETNKGFAGLAMFGTQFIGDHLNLLGTPILSYYLKFIEVVFLRKSYRIRFSNINIF